MFLVCRHQAKSATSNNWQLCNKQCFQIELKSLFSSVEYLIYQILEFYLLESVRSVGMRLKAFTEAGNSCSIYLSLNRLTNLQKNRHSQTYKSFHTVNVEFKKKNRKQYHYEESLEKGKCEMFYRSISTAHSRDDLFSFSGKLGLKIV